MFKVSDHHSELFPVWEWSDHFIKTKKRKLNKWEKQWVVLPLASSLDLLSVSGNQVALLAGLETLQWSINSWTCFCPGSGPLPEQKFNLYKYWRNSWSLSFYVSLQCSIIWNCLLCQIKTSIWNIFSYIDYISSPGKKRDPDVTAPQWLDSRNSP